MADVLSGLTCCACTKQPPHVRITWIAWNSLFRATDLRPGDRIIAVNGTPISDEKTPRVISRAPMQAIPSR